MQPNILFILIDGLRADQCFGVDKTADTTFLDSLITSGAYFKNTFCLCRWNNNIVELYVKLKIPI